MFGLEVDGKFVFVVVKMRLIKNNIIVNFVYMLKEVRKKGYVFKCVVVFS